MYASMLLLDVNINTPSGFVNVSSSIWNDISLISYYFETIFSLDWICKWRILKYRLGFGHRDVIYSVLGSVLTISINMSSLQSP